MKYIISLSILLFSTPVIAQWRDIKISSYTDIRAIQENFRRASLYSNRKLDKYSNETLYGNLTLSDDHKYYGDGTSLTGVAVLSATQTFTGSNTFSQTGTGVTTISSAAITSAVIPTVTGNSNFSTTSSTVTFSGWVDIGWEKITVTNASPSNQETATCSAGKIITGCIGRCNGGATAPLGYYSNANNTCTIYCPSTSDNSIQAICARVK